MALIDKASLLMVPSTYEDGTLYNVLPTGNKAPDETGENNGYDQTRADFTFSRGSNLAATRVNSSGLIEKGRENLLLQSNSFNTTWVNVNSSLTSGQSGYDGTNNAWLLSKSAATGLVKQDIVQSGVQAFSVYAKANTKSWIRLLINGVALAYYDLSNGSVGTTSYNTFIDANIESVGNGWYRCSLVGNGSTSLVNIVVADADNDTSGTSGSIFIQNAQLEKGLIATDVMTSGSVTAQAGILEDMPRINYDANGENGALLLEPSRTNLITQSEYLGAWSTIGSPTITTNYGTSPEGIQNSTRLEGAVGDRIRLGITGVSATYTYSIYAKGSGTIRLRDNSGGYYLDISLNSEWTRYDYSFTASFTNIQIQIVSATDAEIWGAQLEAASYASSLIPTHGAAVTRGADVCKDAGNSNVFNDSEGVLFVEMSALADDNENRILSISDGTTSTRVLIQYYTSSNTIRGFVQGGGVSATLSYTSSDITANSKIAFKYKSGDHALWVNGTEKNTASTAITLSGLDDFSFDNGAGAASMYANVKQAIYFNEALSDNELATLTTL